MYNQRNRQGEKMNSQQKKVVSIMDIIAIGACAIFAVIVFVESAFGLIAGISQDVTSDIIVGAVGLFFSMLLLSIFILKISEIRSHNERTKATLNKTNTCISFSTGVLAICGILLVIILAATTKFKVENFMQYQSAGLLLSILFVITFAHFVCSVIINEQKHASFCDNASEVITKKVMTKKNILFVSLTSVIAFVLIVSSILFGVYSSKPPSRFTETVVLGETGYERRTDGQRWDYNAGIYVQGDYYIYKEEILVFDNEDYNAEVRLTIRVNNTEIRTIASAEPDSISWKSEPVESEKYKGWYLTTFYIQTDVFNVGATAEVVLLEFAIDQGFYHIYPSYSDDFILWSIEKIVTFSIMISMGAILLTTATIWIIDSTRQAKKNKRQS